MRWPSATAEAGAGRGPARNERARSAPGARRTPLPRDRHRAQVLGVGDPQAREPRAGADARSIGKFDPTRPIDVNDYLDRVEAQLTELTERGAHQRRRVRRGARRAALPAGLEGHDVPGARRLSEGLAFLAAAAVVAAVVGIVLVNAHSSKPHPVSSGAPSIADRRPPPPPRAHGDRNRVHDHRRGRGQRPRGPASSYRSRSRRSARSPGGCSARRKCPSGQQAAMREIIVTTDGGVHFTTVGAARGPVDGQPNQPGYAQIRFADSERVRVRTQPVRHPDGGQSWHQVNIGGSVSDLAIPTARHTRSSTCRAAAPPGPG